MARFIERRKAIKLRRQGKTYTYIRARLGVSKGTLSYWIKDIELTPAQQEKIKKEARQKQIEKYIKTTREKRERLVQLFYKNEKETLGRITKRDFLVAGLFLYLGEGTKSSWSKIAISNSNPLVIKFGIFWLTQILNIPKNKIRLGIHLYKDMDIEKELKFWSKIAELPMKQFLKPYVKKTFSYKINHSTFGHGTCNIITYNVNLKHKIMAEIEVIMSSAIGRVA